jgi:hypothetical protein
MQKDAERCRKHEDFRVPATPLSASSRIWVKTHIISSPAFKSCFASKTSKGLATTQSRFPLHSRALIAAFRLEHIGRLRDAKCNADPGE